MDWPSLNQQILMGKVTQVRRIQWADGTSTALIRLCTKMSHATPSGFRKGFDWHEAEISPAERFIEKAWEGAVVMVRGRSSSFEWTPKGSAVSFNRHVLKAEGFQVILPSDRPKTMPPTIFRNYTREAAETMKEHKHASTTADE